MIQILMRSGESYQLPAGPPADQQDIMLKNVSASGQATISGNGNTIDGASSYTLDSLASVTFRWIAGDEWIVISAY